MVPDVRDVKVLTQKFMIININNTTQSVVSVNCRGIKIFKLREFTVCNDGLRRWVSRVKL